MGSQAQDTQFKIYKSKEKECKSKADYQYAMYKSEANKGHKAEAMNHYELSQEFYTLSKEYSEIAAAYQATQKKDLEEK
jgi:hypothetical protein